jgi:predicted NBD/HSP70 family sugar kinase
MLDKYDRSVLNLLYQNGALTRKQLMDKLKMRLNSLVDSCNFLESERYILRTGTHQVRNVPLMLNPARFTVIGAEHTRNALICTLLDPTGKCITQNSYPLAPEVGGAARLNLLLEALQDFANSAGENEICAIGFADIGIVNSAAGDVVYSALVPEWENIAIKAVLEEKFHCMVRIIDRSGAASLEELRRDPGNSLLRNSLQLFAGNGIGASILQHGKYWGAEVPSSCQLGHTIAVPGGKKCHCGNCGCLETVAALPAILEAAKCRDFDEFTAKISAGDPDAQQALDTAAQALGIAVANVVTFTAITHVVIHSSLTALPGFMEQLTETARSNVIYPFDRQVTFAVSTTGTFAGAAGAAFYAQKEFFSIKQEV